MLHQSDDVVLAQLHERRRSLLAEADAHRRARHARSPGVSMLDRLLAALGVRLVHWGDRLQARSRRAHLSSHGSYMFERVSG